MWIKSQLYQGCTTFLQIHQNSFVNGNVINWCKEYFVCEWVCVSTCRVSSGSKAHRTWFGRVLCYGEETVREPFVHPWKVPARWETADLFPANSLKLHKPRNTMEFLSPWIKMSISWMSWRASDSGGFLIAESWNSMFYWNSIFDEKRDKTMVFNTDLLHGMGETKVINLTNWHQKFHSKKGDNRSYKLQRKVLDIDEFQSPTTLQTLALDPKKKESIIQSQWKSQRDKYYGKLGCNWERGICCTTLQIPENEAWSQTWLIFLTNTSMT